MKQRAFVLGKSRSLRASKRISKNAGTEPLRKRFEQGMGYFRPANLPLSQFKKTMKVWEAKLLSSGFQDIEYRNPNQTGTFDSYFRLNGSSHTFESIYNPSVEEYYRLAREFYNYYVDKDANIHRETRAISPQYDFAKLFKRRPALYRYLFILHMHSVPYRQAQLFLRGEKPKRNHNWSEVKAPHSRVKQVRSVFWLHSHTAKALAPFFLWLQTVHGIDATNTYQRKMKSELSQRKRRKP